MKIIPAIDLLGGRAVRLERGQRDKATVFSERPWELAGELCAGGAARLHVVDLDGAFAGARAHAEVIGKIIAAAPVPVQVGGGLRDVAAVRAALDGGAALAVLGTAAIDDPAAVEAACAAHPGRVIIAVDARDGVVAVAGWVRSAGVTAVELARRAAGWGAAAVLYTDVARDGVHAGPNVAATAELVAAVGDRLEVIASGGVSSLDDLRALRAAGVPAAIVGRALYDRRFTVAEAVAAASYPPLR
jgi:phosphoribosylformimino-5-aminoimidazole carboxamide ribotide isomerase